MEINLEKIELVKDRTGCTYAEAKEALEKAEGSVVDAIIAVEESMNKDYAYAGGRPLKENPIFIKMKEIVEKGNVSRILIKKDEKTIVNFPLTAGVIGAVLVPWGAILGIVAALGTKCDIDFVTDKGDVIDINGKVIGAYDKAKEVAQMGVDKLNDLDKSGKIDEVMNSIENAAKTAADKVKNIVDDVTEKYKSSEGETVRVDVDVDEFNSAAEEEFKNEEEL